MAYGDAMNAASKRIEAKRERERRKAILEWSANTPEGQAIKELQRNAINPDAPRKKYMVDEIAKEIEKKIIETGHMTEEEVMEVIGEIIKEQVDEEEYKVLYSMADEIRKDAKEIAQ